jgi:hypothetical protein
MKNFILIAAVLITGAFAASAQNAGTTATTSTKPTEHTQNNGASLTKETHKVPVSATENKDNAGKPACCAQKGGTKSCSGAKTTDAGTTSTLTKTCHEGEHADKKDAPKK